MFDLNTPEIQFAIQSISQAGMLVRQVQRELIVPALTKSDRSPVTVADFASQSLVAYHLTKAFPNDPLVAEEDARELRSYHSKGMLDQVTGFVQKFIPSATPLMVCDWIDRGINQSGGRFWTLDPIDGTKGFLRGDQYAVALALVANGQVQVGVLGCPNLVEARWPDPSGEGSLVIALRGQGTWTCPLEQSSKFVRLQVSECNDLLQARLLRSFESGHTHTDKTEAFIQELGTRIEPRLMDSQAKYALLAAGEGELLLRLLSKDQPDYREKIWDQAAGSLVLEEAGGQITDLDGLPLDFNSGRSLIKNRGILASNQILHGAALQALQSIGV